MKLELSIPTNNYIQIFMILLILIQTLKYNYRGFTVKFFLIPLLRTYEEYITFLCIFTNSFNFFIGIYEKTNKNQLKISNVYK